MTLVLALLAGAAAMSGCQTQKQSASASPAVSPAPAPASTSADHDAESRAVASALAAQQPPARQSPAPTPAPAATPSPAPAATPSDVPQTLVLREGDSVHVMFSGAHSLDNSQTIQRDGSITLEMVGQIKAAGLTAPQLEQEILKAYGDKLVVKECSVVVQTSVFKVFVTGAVLRPGPVLSDHVETPLEAVIEAGYEPEKANLKKVVIVREGAGQNERFIINLADVMKGKPTKPFTLQSMDKIYVPPKFVWF